jgi:predicted permease
MTENVLLAALASGAALMVGRLTAKLLLRAIDAPSNLQVVTDWRTVLFSAVFGLIATLAFGLAPAFQTAKGNPRASGARKILVSIQVAVSCVLLILSAFFTRAVQRIISVGVTFDYQNMAVVDPMFGPRRYSISQAQQALLDLTSRLKDFPGIDGVSAATTPALAPWVRTERVAGQVLYLNSVTSSYFSLLHLPLLEGRIFGPTDQNAVVVGATAARKLWPNESPLGKMFSIQGRTRSVIGVVKDSGVYLDRTPEPLEAYTPILDTDVRLAAILIHTASQPSRLSRALAAAALMPHFPPAIFTLQSFVNQSADRESKTVTIVGTLGMVATVLAMVGIFGLLGFTVTQRTREIGVRMALGAGTWNVARLVVGQYVTPFGIGVAGGITLAGVVVKVLRNLVFGYLSLDLIGFASGLAAFAAVALIAALLPLRRALQVDPASALRSE